MSSKKFSTPKNLATIEETAKRVTNTKIELFGGWVVFSIFAGLSILVLALDTVGLPELMSRFPSNAMDFIDRCKGPGPAGGFAMIFVVLIVVSMASLQVIAPRSVRYGFYFLILTAVLAQAYIAYANTISASLGEWPFVDYWKAKITCPDGSPGVSFGTGINLRYNPQGVDLIGNAFNANVSRSFTDMLAANLGFLFLLAALSSLVALIVSIFRLFSKKSSEKMPLNPPKGIYGFFARSAVEQSILIQTAVWTGLAVISGPILMMFIPESREVSDPIKDILWIGPVVFLFDLARVALWLPEPAAAVEIPETEVVEVTNLILPQVLSDLKGLHGNQLPFDFSLAAGSVATDTTAQEVGKFQRDDIPQPGKGNLHYETLTNWHYDLIIETLNRQVFDRGRTGLFVCPVDVVENVRDMLTKGFSKNPGINVVNWWCFGDPLPENDAIELILVSPESLEALVEEIYNHTEFTGLLGGIFILNLHRMDLGLLLLSMKRLERYVDSASDMVAILQSEFRQGMSEWNKNLPLLGQIPEFRERSQPAFNNAIPQHVAFLHPASNETFDKGMAQWPVGLRSLIYVAKKQPKALPYLFDHHIQHVKGFWSDRIVNSIGNGDDMQTLTWAKDYRTPVLIPEEHAHPVVLLEDRNNLINVLGSQIGTPEAQEALRLISVGRYPGANFLLSKVKEKLGAARTDEDRRETLGELSRQFSSISPAPKDGPVELALMIRQEFKSATRARVGEAIRDEGFKTLNQERIQALWSNNISAALQQMHISNTKAGLEKLFRITLQPSAKGEMLTGKMTDQRSYEYTLTQRATRDINVLATLELSIQDPPSGTSGIERILLADYGLSYASGTRMTLAGRIYEVTGVDVLHRKLSVEYSEGRPAFDYTFVRDYALLTHADDQSGFAADKLVSQTGSIIPHEVASGYLQVARRTRAAFENKSLLTPFDGLQSPPLRSAVDAESRLQIRSSAIVRLYAPNGNPRRGGNFPSQMSHSATSTKSASGALAFTLATTLQDVLKMLFPANAHRIAVLSPQANMPEHSGGINEFAQQRQPSLRPLDAHTETVVARSGSKRKLALNPKSVKDHKTLANAFFERARSVHKADEHQLLPSLDLFVIEDSDHDLGVAKLLTKAHEFNKILDFWRDYVAHCVSTASDPDAGYAFGAGEIADIYDFKAALESLNDMIKQEV